MERDNKFVNEIKKKKENGVIAKKGNGAKWVEKTKMERGAKWGRGSTIFGSNII